MIVTTTVIILSLIIVFYLAPTYSSRAKVIVDKQVEESNRLLCEMTFPKKTAPGVVTTTVKGVQSPEVGAKRIKPREREKFWIDIWLESWERQVGSKYMPVKGRPDFHGPLTVDDVQLHVKPAQAVNNDFQFLLQALHRGEEELTRSLEILEAQGHIVDGRMLTHEERRQKWERQQVMDRPAPVQYLYTQRELTEAEMLKRDIEEYNRKLEIREYITQMEAMERTMRQAMSMPSPMTKLQNLNSYYK